MKMIAEDNSDLRFRQLQNKLRDRWQSVDIFDQDDCDILVVPSFSIDPQLGQKIPGFLHYEERLLFSLIRLRNPHTRVIYISALPLCPLLLITIYNFYQEFLFPMLGKDYYRLVFMTLLLNL